MIDERFNKEDYDEMTGLLSAKSFYIYTSDMLINDSEGKYAMLYFDIHRFKMINELCGIKEADKLILYVADMFSKAAKEGSCCHFRADVFLICLKYNTVEEIEDKVKELIKNIENYQLNCRISPAFGIYLIEDKTQKVNIMVDCARLAFETVKGNYLRKYAFYSISDRAKMFYEKHIEDARERALANDEFEIYYQPKVNADNGKISSCEALARWNHPEDGLLPPELFLDIFEKDDFVITFDAYILEKVFNTMKRWKDLDYNLIPVSINMSSAYINNSKFEDTILRFSEKYDIGVENIIIEVTEDAFAVNESEILTKLERLQNHGFKVSMDKYGRGYSNINVLKNFIFDEVKMDKSFWDELQIGERTKIIYTCSVDMLKKLNTKVVSEGIENSLQADLAIECGCSELQGYYYYEPIPEDEFELLVYAR